MDDELKCPWCGGELWDTEDDGVYWCNCCAQSFWDDGTELRPYEPMPDDDYKLAKMCRGED